MHRFAWFAAVCLSVLPAAAAPDGPAEGAGRALRLGLQLRDAENPLELEVDVFELPLRRGGRRLLLLPDREVPGLPLLSIAFDRDGQPRAELVHPAERRVADALLAWFEAGALLPKEWRAAGSAGSERFRVPSLRMTSKIELSRACIQEGTAPAALVVSLLAPATEGGDGGLRSELRSLEWRFEVDERGEFRGGEMRWELRRSVGAVEEIESASLVVRVLADAPLPADEAARIAKEHDLCAPAVRALLPGQSAEGIADARRLLSQHREEHPAGRLAPLIERLDPRLVHLGEELAGGSLDERADKLVGKDAPEFRLADIDGAELALSSLRGKPVLLSFWGYT